MVQHDSGLIAGDVATIVQELVHAARLGSGQLLVIGASTSEVAGQRIGSAGALPIARQIYAGVEAVRQEAGFYVAFQCCEHLNRSLVVERQVMELLRLEEVSAVPVPHAGGSMAAYAYSQMQAPCLVESVQAHAGIDIGDTFIGMHLRKVAVPIRPSIKAIGEAHVTMAYTRPKLIGGERAIYNREMAIELSGSTCD